MRRLLLALALAHGACVPELGRVLPDQSAGSADDLPLWQGSELPTQIGVGDAPRFDAVTIHTTPDAAVRDAGFELRPLDLRAPDLDAGRWYQANQKNCPSFCQGLGRANVPGPEGAHCMSGEVRSASGIAQGIVFTWGCFSSCAPMGPHQASSDGTNCYMPGQKKDGDPTDRTVGCYCR